MHPRNVRRLQTTITATIIGCVHMAAVSWGEAALPETPPVQADLLADVTAIQPGAPFRMAVRLVMADGWHTYWVNPGDAGQATTIRWELPEGLQARDMQWPHPQRFASGGVVGFGYAGDVWLITEMTTPAELATGTQVALRAHVEWLACADICVPGQADLTLTLPVAAARALSDDTWGHFESAAEHLPTPRPDWHITAQSIPHRNVLILTVNPSIWATDAVATVTFFPREPGVIQHDAPQPLAMTDAGYVLELPVSTLASHPPDYLRGVVVMQALQQPTNREVVSIDLPVISPAIVRSSTISTGALAPDFTLADSHGTSHTLSHYARHWVVLEWLNPDCPYVRKQYDSGRMQELQAYYTAAGIIWLSINSSAAGRQGHMTSDQARAFMQDRMSAQTAILFDHDGTVGRLYGAKTTPHMFIIDPTGAVVYQGAIDDTPSTDPTDVQTATNYVAQALDAALAGREISVATTPPYGCSVKY